MNNSGSLAAVILAAGMGKRMKSDLPKVMHEVGGKPMLWHVIRQARSANAEKIVVIVGHKKEVVIPLTESENVDYAYQAEQLGTGHAVQTAEEKLAGFHGDIIVLSGDVPLLSYETIKNVVEYHHEKEAVATVITAKAADPTGYGRVIRGDDDRVVAIREHKDCNEEELKIDEINSGIYVFKSDYLFNALKNVKNENAQGEYYLPDVFLEYFEKDLNIAAFTADFKEIHGVNNVDDLAAAEAIFKSKN